MKQIFEIGKPKGRRRFQSSITSPSQGLMTIEGKTLAFDFVLKKEDSVWMRYCEDENFVAIRGEKRPLQRPDWHRWSQQFVFNGLHYGQAFEKMMLLKYSYQNSLLREGIKIADIYTRINSQFLFFRLGGRVRMELEETIPFLEPLFYAIAWWWTGCFTDDTPT